MAIKFYEKGADHYSFTNFFGSPIRDLNDPTKSDPKVVDFLQPVVKKIESGAGLFNLRGKAYQSVEHYFQSLKFADNDLQKQIREAEYPREAFNLAQEHEAKIRPGWHTATQVSGLVLKEETMLKALCAKYAQNPQLGKMLLQTGDQDIVEHTRNDEYWGNDLDGTGQNRLGIFLKEVRGALKAGLEKGLRGEQLEDEVFRLSVESIKLMPPDLRVPEEREKEKKEKLSRDLDSLMVMQEHELMVLGSTTRIRLHEIPEQVAKLKEMSFSNNEDIPEIQRRFPWVKSQEDFESAIDKEPERLARDIRRDFNIKFNRIKLELEQKKEQAQSQSPKITLDQVKQELAAYKESEIEAIRSIVEQAEKRLDEVPQGQTKEEWWQAVLIEAKKDIEEEEKRHAQHVSTHDDHVDLETSNVEELKTAWSEKGSKFILNDGDDYNFFHPTSDPSKPAVVRDKNNKDKLKILQPTDEVICDLILDIKNSGNVTSINLSNGPEEAKRKFRLIAELMEIKVTGFSPDPQSHPNDQPLLDFLSGVIPKIGPKPIEGYTEAVQEYNEKLMLDALKHLDNPQHLIDIQQKRFDDFKQKWGDQVPSTHPSENPLEIHTEKKTDLDDEDLSPSPPKLFTVKDLYEAMEKLPNKVKHKDLLQVFGQEIKSQIESAKKQLRSDVDHSEFYQEVHNFIDGAIKALPLLVKEPPQEVVSACKGVMSLIEQAEIDLKGSNIGRDQIEAFNKLKENIIQGFHSTRCAAVMNKMSSEAEVADIKKLAQYAETKIAEIKNVTTRQDTEEEEHQSFLTISGEGVVEWAKDNFKPHPDNENNLCDEDGRVVFSVKDDNIQLLVEDNDKKILAKFILLAEGKKATHQFEVKDADPELARKIWSKSTRRGLPVTVHGFSATDEQVEKVCNQIIKKQEYKGAKENSEGDTEDKLDEINVEIRPAVDGEKVPANTKVIGRLAGNAGDALMLLPKKDGKDSNNSDESIDNTKEKWEVIRVSEKQLQEMGLEHLRKGQGMGVSRTVGQITSPNIPPTPGLEPDPNKLKRTHGI